MRAALFTFLLAAGTASACDSDLLDQDFRKLAADETVNLCEAYEGQVVLVVNTASKCGNTPQYDGLEAMYTEKKGEGLAVLGFPSNDFMGQEPGTEEQIEEFCRLTYGVQFPMFEKTTVKGPDAHAFYKALAAESGTEPGWNFHKYLIGRDGKLIETFSARTKPDDPKLVAAIDKALAEG
ncbi:MAG: glutathione peroxidase [Pseudomonadota bacterium]